MEAGTYPPRMSCAQEARSLGARSGPPFSLLPGMEGWGLSGSIGLVPSLTPRGAGDRGVWLLAQSCFRSRGSGARTPGISTGASVDSTRPVFKDFYLELGAGMFMNFQCRDGLKSNVCLGLDDSNIESLSKALESAGETEPGQAWAPTRIPGTPVSQGPEWTRRLRDHSGVTLHEAASFAIFQTNMHSFGHSENIQREKIKPL